MFRDMKFGGFTKHSFSVCRAASLNGASFGGAASFSDGDEVIADDQLVMDDLQALFRGMPGGPRILVPSSQSSERDGCCCEMSFQRCRRPFGLMPWSL